MNNFCTITTADHLYKVYALADSLQTGSAYTLHVLVVDGPPTGHHPACRFWSVNELLEAPQAVLIASKYRNNNDKLRWSLKPVFMGWLLQQQLTDKIIYLDNDLFFFSDYRFLFELLDTHTFLLSPHYYKDYPDREQNWLEANFRVGLYNAGFVGASAQAQDILQWWAGCCAYRCQKNSFRGLFDDQKYLDLIPIKDEKAHVLRHMGCNVAGWNMAYCKRETVDGHLLINGKFPIVFIHFNNTTVREIMTGADTILIEQYRQYIRALKNYNPAITEQHLLVPMPWADRFKYAVWKLITDWGI